MSIIGQVFIFAFGAMVGSFLNAVLWRLRCQESFIVGRSYCPECRHNLAALDLVPIVSYLLLGGKCRYCRKPISPSYLLVEIAAGTLFLLAAIQAAVGRDVLSPAFLPQLLLYWYFIAVLILVFVYDLRYMLILPSVTIPAAIIAIIGNLALGRSWWSLLLGCFIGAGFFYLQLVLSRGEWIGGGDVYLGFLLGAILGWPLVLVALFLAYVSGASVGLILLTSKKKTLKSQLAFGTFLSAATVVSMLYGNSILLWYLGIAV